MEIHGPGRLVVLVGMTTPEPRIIDKTVVNVPGGDGAPRGPVVTLSFCRYFQRGQHAIHAHPPGVIPFHEPGAPALAAAVPGKVLEGGLDPQFHDVIGPGAAVDLAALEQDPFGVQWWPEPIPRRREVLLLPGISESGSGSTSRSPRPCCAV